MFKLSDVILNPRKAERHPFEVLVLGFVYASISLFLSFWIFPDYASIVMIFLSSIACLYVVQSAIIREEKREKNIYSEKFILKRHIKVINLFLFLFLGFLLAFTFWQIVLPESFSIKVFQIQNDEVVEIRSLTGNSINTSESLSIILSNNFRVLFLSLVFSLFYGAGSIFILAWNASVLGFVIGNLAKNTLGLVSLPHIFLKYFLHGIPEMISYFLAALAGGILFIAIVRDDLKSGRIKRTLIDSFIILLIAAVILIIAGIAEVYLSPFI